MQSAGMNERARKLVERGRIVVNDQRQRIVRLRAIGASTDEAEAALVLFEMTLAALEYHKMKQTETPGA